MTVEISRTLPDPRGIYWATTEELETAVKAATRIANNRDRLPMADRRKLWTEVDRIIRSGQPANNDNRLVFPAARTKILDIQWDLSIVGYDGESLEDLMSRGYPVTISDDVREHYPDVPSMHYTPREVAYHPQMSFIPDTMGRPLPQVRLKQNTFFEAITRQVPKNESTILQYLITNPAIMVKVLMDLMRSDRELPLTNYRAWVKPRETGGYKYSKYTVVVGGKVDPDSVNPGSELVVSCVEEARGDVNTGLFYVVEPELRN